MGVQAISAPTLSSPANGATGVSLTPTFTWNNVQGADFYAIQVSATNNFDPVAGGVNNGSQTNSYTIGGSGTTSSPLVANTTYYWHVDSQTVQNG